MNPTDYKMTRRETLVGLGSLMVAGSVWAIAPGTTEKRYQKAVISGTVSQAELEQIKAAGFEGIELNVWNQPLEELTTRKAEEFRRLTDQVGLRIHSLLRGWAEFNHSDPAKVQKSLEFTRVCIEMAPLYGADAILLVPGRIAPETVPAKGSHRIEFDQTTGMMTAVKEESNKDFSEYIRLHNESQADFQKHLGSLISDAEQKNVILAIENVWNNLYTDPNHFTWFIDSFSSPYLQAYFDLANHLVYGPSVEEWIRILGGRIARVHVKDFRLSGDGGEFVNLLDGSVPWSSVMKALDETGYIGWLTIEGSDGLTLEQRSSRLEKIIASKL